MSNFTPEQIQEILDLYFENFAHRQYIGARYVPIFGRKDEESIEWDNSAPYEPLTIVLHEGNSYTSRQFVPTGVAITNTDYWAETGSYNAQVEQYRQEVLNCIEEVTGFDSRIDTLEDALPIADFDSENTVKTYVDYSISSLGSVIPAASFDSTNTVKKYIDTETKNRIVDDNNGWYAVWIGDSFTIANYMSDQSKRFSSIVSAHYGLTEKNYAVGSTGFIKESTSSANDNFAQQLANAVNDTSFDHSKVKYVFVVGGRNDTTDDNSGTFPNAATITTAVSNVISGFANSDFVNARLVMIPLVYECVVPSSLQYRYYEYLMYNINSECAINNVRALVIDKAYQWLQGKYSCIRNADKIHPNDRGHSMIANNIIGKLEGEFNYSPAMSLKLNMNNELTYKSGEVQKCGIIIDDEGTIWLNLKCNITSAIPFGTVLASVTFTPAYDSSDCLFVMRGHKVFESQNDAYFQVLCNNNFSLNAASASVEVQLISTSIGANANGTNLFAYTPIGKVGVDTTLNGAL